MQRTLPNLVCTETLSVLSLSGLQMGEVPAAVRNLCHLTELDLAYNCLTIMPAEPYLAQLRHLYLDGNDFKAVLEEICGAAGTLEILILDNCMEMAVQLGAPDKLRCMQRLRVFSLVRGKCPFKSMLGASPSVSWSSTSLKMIAQLGRDLPHTCFEF